MCDDVHRYDTEHGFEMMMARPQLRQQRTRAIDFKFNFELF